MSTQNNAHFFTGAPPKSLLTAALQKPLTSRQTRNLTDKAYMNISKQIIQIRLNVDIDDETTQLFIDNIKNYINDRRKSNSNNKVDIYHTQFPGGENAEFNAYNALLTNPNLSTANKILIVKTLLLHLEINHGSHSPLITWVKWCLDHETASVEDIALLKILLQNITDRRKKDKHEKEALDYVVEKIQENKETIPKHVLDIYNKLVGTEHSPSIYFNDSVDERHKYLGGKDIPKPLTHGGRKTRSAKQAKPAAKQAKPVAKQAKPKKGVKYLNAYSS